jgi:hypothetical protein
MGSHSYEGKIYDIEATGLVLPYGTKTGWE